MCRELGYVGVIQVYSSAAFGEGTGFVWMDNVRCNGREEHLSDCPFSGWGVTTCTHAMDAGVWCGSKCIHKNYWPFTAHLCIQILLAMVQFDWSVVHLIMKDVWKYFMASGVQCVMTSGI